MEIGEANSSLPSVPIELQFIDSWQKNQQQK